MRSKCLGFISESNLSGSCTRSDLHTGICSTELDQKVSSKGHGFPNVRNRGEMRKVVQVKARCGKQQSPDTTVLDYCDFWIRSKLLGSRVVQQVRRFESRPPRFAKTGQDGPIMRWKEYASSACFFGVISLCLV